MGQTCIFFSTATCSPMFHFRYSGNFMEVQNKIQQVANSAVSIHRNAALFTEGGKIVVWAMQNMDLAKEFAICFEFMTTSYSGEIALISNDFKSNHFSYKITYIPSMMAVKVYIMLENGNVVELSVNGVVSLKYCLNCEINNHNDRLTMEKFFDTVYIYIYLEYF